jgi:hypothetical protein
MKDMIKAVQGVREALKAPQHNEVHEDLLSVCHGLP